jgi:hypothetical protein
LLILRIVPHVRLVTVSPKNKVDMVARSYSGFSRDADNIKSRFRFQFHFLYVGQIEIFRYQVGIDRITDPGLDISVTSGCSSSKHTVPYPLILYRLISMFRSSENRPYRRSILSRPSHLKTIDLLLFPVFMYGT